MVGNLSRVVPAGLRPAIGHGWQVPEIFRFIQDRGKIPEAEMHRVFNMGVGVAFVVNRRDQASLVALAAREGIGLIEVGTLERG